jgi:[protein]-arginine 3-hydroxylase / protease
MRVQPLERIDASLVHDLDRDLVARERPIIITSVAETGTGALTLHELKTSFGHVKIPVRRSDDELDVFFAQFRRDRGRTMMALGAYIDSIHGEPSSDGRPVYAGNISLLHDPAVKRALVGLLDRLSFPSWMPERSGNEYRLWIGAAGQRSTIHNDPYHNMNVQVVGTKKFIVFSPESHPALYPEFFNSGMWASRIDPLKPDLNRYPAFTQALGFKCELQPGEMLFLPRFWWHYVEATSVCVNINCWLESRASGDKWWHQQPAARQFIAYDSLLESERHRFENLPPDLQDATRVGYVALRDDLLRLANATRSTEQGAGNADAR